MVNALSLLAEKVSLRLSKLTTWDRMGITLAVRKTCRSHTCKGTPKKRANQNLTWSPTFSGIQLRWINTCFWRQNTNSNPTSTSMTSTVATQSHRVISRGTEKSPRCLGILTIQTCLSAGQLTKKYISGTSGLRNSKHLSTTQTKSLSLLATLLINTGLQLVLLPEKLRFGTLVTTQPNRTPFLPNRMMKKLPI